MKVIVNPCKRKEFCYNYPDKCDLCIVTSDSVNCYPCFQDKDIVEVVRCKDCESWKKYENTAGFGYCHCEKFQFRYGQRMDRVFNPVTGPNDFCSNGKRKDES